MALILRRICGTSVRIAKATAWVITGVTRNPVIQIVRIAWIISRIIAIRIPATWG